MMTDSTLHPTHYAIEIEGQLDAGWQEWFDDLTVTTTAGGNTRLHGAIMDQAALYGILKRINNLGLRLISVNPELDT